MKNYLNKHKITLVFILIFAFIFIVGGMFSRYMTNQISVHEEESGPIEIVAFDYNFDLQTVATYPYLVYVAFGNDNHATLLLTRSLIVSGQVSGDSVSNSDLIDLQLLLSTTTFPLSDRSYIESYDSTTNTVVIKTQGFHDVITVSVDFSSDFTMVESYHVDSTESYEQTNLYTGDPVPAVENYYMDGFKIGNTSLDAVTGASIGTSVAMQDLVVLLGYFQAAQIGGN